jgi:hypothetical protein
MDHTTGVAQTHQGKKRYKKGLKKKKGGIKTQRHSHSALRYFFLLGCSHPTFLYGLPSTQTTTGVCVCVCV